MLVASASVLFLGVSPSALATLGRNPTLSPTGRRCGDGSSALCKIQWSGLASKVFGSARLEKMWSIYWWHPNEAHNGYIEIYINLGWIGIALLVMVLASGYRTVMAAVRRGPAFGQPSASFFLVGMAYNSRRGADNCFKFRLQPGCFCLADRMCSVDHRA